MTLQEFLSKAGQLIGLAEKGASQTIPADQSAKIADLEKQVSDGKEREKQSAERITKLETDNSALTVQLGEANTKLQATEQKLELTEKSLTEARQSVTDFDGKVEKAASAKAAQITGAQGQPGIVDPPKTQTGTISATAEPKGINRVIAAFSKQLTK